jgi:tetratricopeptide (TPR) repeat protein
MTRYGKSTAISVAALCSLTLVLSGCNGAKSREERYVARAQQYLARGQFDKARVEFRNALQIAPTSGDLRYYNGLVAEKLGNVQEAVQYYRSAIDADKDQIQARANFGRLLLLAGFTDLALQQINPGLDSHPNDVPLLVVHATALQQKKDTAGARREAQRAVSLNPRSEDAIAALASIETRAGDVDAALQLVSDAVRRLPDSVDLRRVLVQVYLQRNDTTRAEQELQELTRLRPDDGLSRIQLAQLYSRTDRLGEAESTLRMAVKAVPRDEEVKKALIEFLWSRRGHDVAEAELKRMIEAAPQDPELHFELASLYEESGSAATAEAEYKGLIARQGEDPYGERARDGLAKLYTLRGNAPDAQQLIADVLKVNPADTEALALRASAELARGEALSAISDLRAILRGQPNSVGLLQALAQAYSADGEPQLAEDTARRAVELDPSDVKARTQLAQVLLGSSKFDESRAILTELHTQHPDNAAALNLLCRANVGLNDLVAARADATELAHLLPGKAIGPFLLGYVAEAEHRPDEALSHYQHALELEPRGVEPLTATVVLLQKQKRFDEALTLLDEISQRNPKAAIGPSLKGEVLLTRGSLPQAETAFREAMKRSPKWWNPYRGLAYVELERHDQKGAKAILKQAVSGVQLAEPERLDLAVLMTRVGQYDDAINQYEIALKLNPKSQTAAAGLALLLVSFRTDQTSLNRALALVRPLAGSNDWRMLDAFGWVQFKNQDLNAALPALERAATQGPDVSQVRFHLGMAQLRAGKADMAEKNLAEALAHDNRFFGHDEARAILADLRSPKS